MSSERQQAENEKRIGEEAGNAEAVKAAEKRLAALGGERTAEPVEAQAPKSRQTKRA